MERNLPGGPPQSPDLPANDRSYRNAHQARSVEVVTAWLEEQGRSDLVPEVGEVVGAHEWGDRPGADLVQAADSISFLETTAREAPGWVSSGRYTRERTVEQITWMYERIHVPRARELARPLYERAMSELGRRSGRPGPP